MASDKLPLVEPIGAYSDKPQNPGFGPTAYPRRLKKRSPWYHSQRFRIFSATTLLCATLGLIIDFSRPAVFGSSAVLLTVSPDRVGAEVVDASLQHALIQKKLLSAKETIDATLAQLQRQGYAPEQLPNSAELQSMLSIVPHDATNLLAISVEGPSAEILPVLLNTLVSAYAQSRSDAIAAAVAETSDALRQQQLGLAQQIAIQREELENFRADNNILSLGRDENEVYAKLKGLTKALNNALEKRVTRKAELDAMQAAAAQGKSLIAPSDERAFSNLQLRQRKLREKLGKLDNLYTREYMALHPEMKAIPEQLAAVEKQLAEKAATGKTQVLAIASRNYQAAQNAEIALQRQLNDYKQTALTFSNSFALHEVKKEALIQLQEHQRVIQQRITELQIEQQQKYPQISVIEPAYLSSKAIRPYYWRDAAYIAAGSLLLGLLAIWLYEFLRRSQPQDEDLPPAPNYVTVLDPRLMETAERLIPQSRLAAQAASEPPPSLEQTTHTLPGQAASHATIRELNDKELNKLLAGADIPTQQLIALLLSGIRPDELVTLTTRSFASIAATTERQIILNTFNPRALSIPEELQQLLARTHNFPEWLNTGESTNDEYFNAMLNCAAIDAGLDSPANIDSTLLHQSYICFLVRTGIKLSELGHIVGHLSPIELTQYGQLSPPGPGLSAQQMDTVHPLLQALEATKKRIQYH